MAVESPLPPPPHSSEPCDWWAENNMLTGLAAVGGEGVGIILSFVICASSRNLIIVGNRVINHFLVADMEVRDDIRRRRYNRRKIINRIVFIIVFLTVVYGVLVFFADNRVLVFFADDTDLIRMSVYLSVCLYAM